MSLQSVKNVVVDRFHPAQYRPELGPAQAGLGPLGAVRSPIVKKSKGLDPKLMVAIDKMLDVVAENVRREIGDRPISQVVKESGVSKGSVQRILGGSRGYAGQEKSAAQVDTLLRLAWYLRTSFTGLFISHDRTSTLLNPPREHQPDILVRDLERPRRRPPTRA